MTLSYRLTHHSRARIGHFFGGRHPATVLHACRAVERRCRGDARLRKTMQRITLQLIAGDFQ